MQMDSASVRLWAALFVGSENELPAEMANRCIFFIVPSPFVSPDTVSGDHICSDNNRSDTLGHEAMM